MTTKILTALAAVLVIAGGLWRLEYLAAQNEKVSAELKSVKAELAAANAAAEDARADLEKENLNRTEYLAQIRDIKDENSRYRDCIAANTCGVRIVRANCPAMPETDSSAGIEPGAPVLDAALQQNILDLRSEILTLEADFSLCQKTLLLWSM